MTPQRLKAIKQLNATFNQAGPLAQALDEAIAEIDKLEKGVASLITEYHKFASEPGAHPLIASAVGKCADDLEKLLRSDR